MAAPHGPIPVPAGRHYSARVHPHAIVRGAAIGLATTLLLSGGGLGGLLLWAYGGPVAVLARPLPSEGAAEIGVDYRVSVDCVNQFRAGDLVWRVEAGEGGHRRSWIPRWLSSSRSSTSRAS